MHLRDTRFDEIDHVVALESGPEAAPFVVQWPAERHLLAIRDAGEAHLTIEDDGGAVGFVLLAGIGDPSGSIELRRIVVSPAGRGLGRTALTLVIDHVFEHLQAHRLWLDVKLDNHRAQRAYERAGFVREGVRRDALLTDGRYESLIVMSIRTRAATGRRSAGNAGRPAARTPRG